MALLGAIVLGGIGASGGISVEALARTASEPALAYAFRFVFLAAMLILCFGLAFLIGMEEKPLRGPALESPPTDLGPLIASVSVVRIETELQSVHGLLRRAVRSSQ